MHPNETEYENINHPTSTEINDIDNKKLLYLKIKFIPKENLRLNRLNKEDENEFDNIFSNTIQEWFKILPWSKNDELIQHVKYLCEKIKNC